MTLTTGHDQITYTETEAGARYLRDGQGNMVVLRRDEARGRILGQMFPRVGYCGSLGAFETWADAENEAICWLAEHE